MHISLLKNLRKQKKHMKGETIINAVIIIIGT